MKQGTVLWHILNKSKSALDIGIVTEKWGQVPKMGPIPIFLVLSFSFLVRETCQRTVPWQVSLCIRSEKKFMTILLQ